MSMRITDLKYLQRKFNQRLGRVFLPLQTTIYLKLCMSLTNQFHSLRERRIKAPLLLPATQQNSICPLKTGCSTLTFCNSWHEWSIMLSEMYTVNYLDEVHFINIYVKSKIFFCHVTSLERKTVIICLWSTLHGKVREKPV